LSSTAINDSIASSHPLNVSVIKGKIFVAVVPRGVEWDENINVKFIFLLAMKLRSYRMFIIPFYTLFILIISKKFNKKT
jgi:mannitol/fructose-specific phosphotransferase system IIA component